MNNFLWAEPENQQRSQLEVGFYARPSISVGDQVGYSSGGGTMNYIF